MILIPIPGHKIIYDNEKADDLARKGSARKITGPEPAFGIPLNSATRAVHEWVKHNHIMHWSRVEGNRHSKRMMKKPSSSLTADLLKFNRAQIRLVIGHCVLRKHLHTMRIFKQNPVCRLCNEEKESTSHVILECVQLNCRRYELFKITNKEEDLPEKNLISRILRFANSTDLFNRTMKFRSNTIDL